MPEVMRDADDGDRYDGRTLVLHDGTEVYG